MTDKEKAQMLVRLLQPEEVDEALAEDYITLSKYVVLNRRYPFGIPEGEEVPEKYEALQVQIAIDLYNRRGAEGQISHTENQISRSWSDAQVSPSLLNRIVPVAKAW